MEEECIIEQNHEVRIKLFALGNSKKIKKIKFNCGSGALLEESDSTPMSSKNHKLGLKKMGIVKPSDQGFSSTTSTPKSNKNALTAKQKRKGFRRQNAMEEIE